MIERERKREREREREREIERDREREREREREKYRDKENHITSLTSKNKSGGSLAMQGETNFSLGFKIERYRMI